MSDSEILTWILSKLESGKGLDCHKRHEWFLDGEVYVFNHTTATRDDYKKFDELKASGRLVLLETGFTIETDLAVEWGTTLESGSSLKEAIVNSILAEKKTDE